MFNPHLNGGGVNSTGCCSARYALATSTCCGTTIIASGPAPDYVCYNNLPIPAATGICCGGVATTRVGGVCCTGCCSTAAFNTSASACCCGSSKIVALGTACT